MSLTVTCPDCLERLRVPSDLAGKRVRCRHCDASMRVPWDTEDEDEPRLRRIRREDPDEDRDEEEERPRRKQRKRARGDWGKVLGVSLFVLLGLLLLGGAVWALVQLPGLLKVREPVISADQWQTLEVPNRFRIVLPGKAVQKPQPVGPFNLTMILYECNPTKDLMCGVGYLQGELPPERRNLPADQLLADACDGASANLKKMGGTEIKRTAIAHAGYPGRELIINVPKGQGKLVSRIFLVNRSIVMVMVAGKGIEPDGAIAQKVFGSLQLPILKAP